MKVAFDCDGTLIDLQGNPRHEVIDLFRTLKALGCEMFIWSGGGVDYAGSIARRLGLNAIISRKGSFKPDLAVDDMDTSLGIANLIVAGAVNEEG